MQINFDELFNKNQNKTNKQHHEASFQKTEHSFTLTSHEDHKINHKKSPKVYDNHAYEEQMPLDRAGRPHQNSIYQEDKDNKIKNLLQLTSFQDDVEAERGYFYYKKNGKNNDDKQPSNNSMMKKMGKKEVNEMTSRLTEQIICQRKQCKQMVDGHISNKIKNEALPYSIKNEKKTLKQVCKYYQKHPTSEIHERLYREYLEKQFRGIELSKQFQQKFSANNHMQNYENSEYLENYTNFYTRLDKQVELYFKKQQYYENRTKIQKIRKNTDAFHPNIQASQKSLAMLNAKPKIKPKQQKHRIKGTYEMMKELSFYTVNEDMISKNKFDAKFQEQKEQFIKRICMLFDYDGEFLATPDAIQQLNQNQFDVIFPLISQFEQNQETMSIQRFEQEVRKFYEVLGMLEKRKIRDSGQKKTIRTLRCNTERQPYEKTLQTSRKKKNTKVGKDYLTKIQNFV